MGSGDRPYLRAGQCQIDSGGMRALGRGGEEETIAHYEPAACRHHQRTSFAIVGQQVLWLTVFLTGQSSSH